MEAMTPAAAWKVGTVLSSADVVLAERMAAEFDFVWIDLEHSALTVRDAQLLAIASRAGGACCYARVPRYDSDLLGALLDAGVDGIVAPKVESGSQARALAASMAYPPQGSRGFAPRRATGGLASVGSVGDGSNPRCFAQIETREAVNRADEIASTPGVDALIVGTADLSFDLGNPLDMHASELVEAIFASGQAADRHGKAWGVAVGQLPPWVGEVRKAGASMLVFSSDLRLYVEAVQASARRAREA